MFANFKKTSGSEQGDGGDAKAEMLSRFAKKGGRKGKKHGKRSSKRG
jgi:hypothetical protein